ncbi:hypothetical protein IPF86_03615 [Candidatus Nomurabacteria bacterium]|jgi:hypothetical protein|nr:MAG: hypothetical protein IPF86_03615 [Candidatus Nomurabacteria bacterium]
MPKKIVEDMVKSNKREPSVFFSELAKATNKNLSGMTPQKTIPVGEVTPPLPQAPMQFEPMVQKAAIPTPVLLSKPIPPVQRPPAGRKLHPGAMLWTVAGLTVVILLFALSFLFSGATVTVKPKKVSLDLVSDFTANKDAVMPTLPFQLMAITADQTIDVPATSSTTESKKATGRVILYNAYSASPQNLLINTRLEAASNNKIYFTDTAVVIPGQTVKNGQKIPGQIEIAVTATEPGPEYNTDLTDFTIVGFKGTSKYTGYYGRSKTEITGGTSGLVNTITPEAATAAYTDVSTKLEKTLADRIRNELPEGFVLFDDALFITLDSKVPPTQSSEPAIPVTASGSAQAFIFKKTDLYQTIAKSLVPNFDELPVTIPNLDSLSFTLTNKATMNPKSVTSVSFTLGGQTNIVWDVASEEIIDSLLDKKKRDFESIMSTYKNIDSALVVLRPFWQTTFPSKREAIHVLLSE